MWCSSAECQKWAAIVVLAIGLIITLVFLLLELFHPKKPCSSCPPSEPPCASLPPGGEDGMSHMCPCEFTLKVPGSSSLFSAELQR